jgi:NosR/NirI family transcriptional regulator, nitrous oxide reductase regulator
VEPFGDERVYVDNGRGKQVKRAFIAVALAARIITNPNPAGELKQLFPNAVSFSALTGDPLHYTAYAVDPKTNPSAPPVGYAFWTTDMVPDEHGYHGPIHILVGLDLKGTLTGAVVDYDSEPYGYFSVEPPKFAAQFKGKTIRDPFVVGRDVEAVSRASISIASATRAIRDGSRLAAGKLLPPEAFK